MNWHNLQTQLGDFTKKLIDALNELGIKKECENLKIDHICIRLKNSSDVDKLKKELESVGQIISATNVNGREIIKIELTQPLNLGFWKTYGIELPYPKSNHDYEDGWEHVEFVLGGIDNTMDGVRKTFLEKFANLDIQKLKDKYSYSEDEPQSEKDELPNPTIGLRVNNIGIKFHTNSIQTVVGFKNN